MHIRLIKEPRAQAVEVEVPKGATIEDIYFRFREELPYTVLAAKVDHKLVALTERLHRACTVEFLDMRTQAANLIYQYGLSFLYLRAVDDVLGRVDTDILHSLNQGLYTEIHTPKPPTKVQIQAIEERMREIVSEDLPLREEVITREEALAGLDELLLQDKKRLLEETSVKRVHYYDLDGFKNFFYGHMVPSAGYLQHFALHPYEKGLLLRFPHPSDPSKIPPYVDDRKMYETFQEASRWQELLGISYVTDLNEKIKTGGMREVVQLSEALHEKRIVEIAGEIVERGKHIVLIAGPSSSGKTTFARRLCIQLAVNGLRPLYLGTDDYFVDREDTPLDEHGEPDYENLSAIDIDLFNTHMNALLAGEEVDLPTFDFVEGRKVFGQRITTPEPGQPIVIEGIHALNGKLTAKIREEEKYKIYISPLTELNIDRHNRIPTTDARMLRRMVRDYRYRGHPAQETIRDWPKVRAGEDQNIFPYNGEADAFFNSVHIYELAVLKKYAEPLLREIGPEEPEVAEAARLLRFLNFFRVYEEEDVIANNSILREFIGGSVFHKS